MPMANLLLFYPTAGVVLTPLYDALCTAAYPSLTDKMTTMIGCLIDQRYALIIRRLTVPDAEDASLNSF